ncbi:DNA mismatch repair protein MutL containing protein [Aphelenchoides avenae]|nr:DNA mismatch repair protein MutL containing protein [Aphelenchus avenae]
MANRIICLSEDVVNKIAAGEVVVRPVNAVKELIENSLDAGATEVTVHVKKGGLDLIKVQDNGSGIRAEDMPIVCARHTTSKLSSVDDLRRMRTYGFRGEALASISFVSSVTIISRTADNKCAHKGVFKDGKMVGTLAHSAGLPGTTITAENLFYNCPSRKDALRYPQDEANRIADLLIRYAINFPSVAFAFRRIDGNADFRSTGNGDKHAVIRALLSAKCTKELIDFDFKDERLQFSVRACMSNPETAFTSTAIQARHDRQKVFHLFINGRSVDCPKLKQSLDVVFSSKDSSCPFITLALEEVQELVDQYRRRGMIEVNSGACVRNMTERAARASIDESAPTLGNDSEDQSTSAGRKRMYPYAVPADLPDRMRSGRASLDTKKASTSGANGSTAATPKAVNPSKMVRVDATNRSLHEFFGAPQSETKISAVQMIPVHVGQNSQAEASDISTHRQSHMTQATQRTFEFDSLKALRREICQNVDSELREILHKHVFIGFYSLEFGLLQCGTRAYMFRTLDFVREFFYQHVIFSFGNVGAYKLNVSDTESGISLKELLFMHLMVNATVEPLRTAEVEERLDAAAALLLDARDLLWDYFGIEVVDAPGQGPALNSVPCLLDGYFPEIHSLPQLVFDLTCVNYEHEKECYEGVARALAEYFTPKTYGDADSQQRCQTMLQRLVIPTFKTKFLPSKQLRKSINVVISTEEAFKQFGRC